MKSAEPIVCRAILCHAPSDRAEARRLQRRLQRFPIDRDLVGQDTPIGPVPASLRPIGRLSPARDELTELDAPTVAALDQAEMLIVIGSPAAARSAQLNAQVRHFRHHHPDHAVIAVVVAGAEVAGHDDLFPPALCYELDADGAITAAPAHIEVGDMRRESGERARVPAEIAAFVTGLDAGALFDHARSALRRQILRGTAIGIIAVVLLTGGFYGGLQGYRELMFRNDIATLVTRHAPASAPHAAPGAQEFQADAIRSIRLKAFTDQRHSHAMAHLRAQRMIEAESVLSEIAYELSVQPNADRAQAAESFRNYAAIAALVEPLRARDGLARAAMLNPSHPETLFRVGWLAASTERRAEAEAAFRALLALPAPAADRRELVWARIGLGEIALARGDLTAAAGILLEARAAATRAAQSADPARQRDLAVAHERFGDIQIAQRDFVSAEQSYRSSQAILVRLAEAEKGNLAWQRDVALSHGKLGDLLLARGDVAGALRAHATVIGIFQRMAAAQPRNTDWPRDIARAHTRIADAREALGDRIAAREARRAGMAILEQLAAREPFATRLATNAELHRELFLAFVGMAELLLRAGDPAAARPLAARAVTLATDLATYFPRHPQRQSDQETAEAVRQRIATAMGGG